MRKILTSLEEFEEFLDEIRYISIYHEDDYDFSPLYNLNLEKGFIHYKFEEMETTGVIYEKENVKSGEKANFLREKADSLFNSDDHNEETHTTILELYTESISLAPKNTEVLALAYGSRSGFLYHLKIYKESIMDCDKAVQISNSELLKLKLLLNKIKCLIALRDKSVMGVYDLALKMLEECNFNEERRKSIRGMYKDLSNSIFSLMADEDIKEEKIDTEEIAAEPLPTFTPSTEVPCASEAIKIAFTKKWGRHIVATRDIEPGEVLSLEKHYITFPNPERMYTVCSRCMKASYNLIPCDNCIFDLYCSEKCKLEAYEKYHQIECKIYPYLGSGKSEFRMLFHHLRCMLISIKNIGGIGRLRRELITISKQKDLRTKGFMEDGKFHSEHSRSLLSMHTVEHWENDYYYGVDPYAAKTCYTVYYLATMTTYFGKMFRLTPIEMTTQPEIMFFAALLLKQFFSLPYHKYLYNVHTSKYEAILLGSGIYTFSHMYNHGCWPNADYIIKENNELVVFSKQPITKGSQIFLNFYDINFTHDVSSKRRYYFENIFKFTCKCQACAENWANSLPSMKELLRSTPDLAKEIHSVIEENNRSIRKHYLKGFINSKESFKNLVTILNAIGKKVTVCCKEYGYYQYLLKRMFIESYGIRFIEVPDSC